jgi:hypothetical protein
VLTILSTEIPYAADMEARVTLEVAVCFWTSRKSEMSASVIHKIAFNKLRAAGS